MASSVVLRITYAATPNPQVPDAGATAGLLGLTLPLLGFLHRRD